MAMTTIPPSLAETYARWDSGSRPSQEGFAWRPESWTKRFTRNDAPRIDGIDLPAAVEEIADAAGKSGSGKRELIDRTVVRKLHTPEKLRSADAQSVVTAFVAAMVWGYGATGYGPYRTARVLTADQHAVEHLVEIAGIAQGSKRGGEKAFAHIAEQRLGREPYLKYLGPAFGTKFLYFLTAASDGVETTPVLDAVVRRWFAREAQETLYTTWWDPDSYSRYLGLLDQWRTQMAAATGSDPLEREEVELLIFSAERGDATSWLADDSPVWPEELGLDLLLDALGSEVEQLAARDRADSKEGPELLRRLRGWVEKENAVGL